MHDEHVSLPKSVSALDDMEEDEDDVYMVSIHNRYAAWPSSLDKMCLAKFTVSYEPVYKGKQSHDRDVNDDDVDANEGEVADMSDMQQNVITSFGDLGCIRKCKFDSILHMASFKQHAEPDKVLSFPSFIVFALVQWGWFNCWVCPLTVNIILM